MQRILFLLSLLGLTALAAEPGSTIYDQKMDVLYGEVDGTGLLMDVFLPKGKKNGLAIVDVASGAWHSDRGKIRDHQTAQLYNIFCSRGYTVFAIRPGSRPRYTLQEMDRHVKMGIRFVKSKAADYSIDPQRVGLTGASAGGHLASLAALTPEEAKNDPKQPTSAFGSEVKSVAIFFPPTDFLDWGGKRADLMRLGDLFFRDGLHGKSEPAVDEAVKRVSPFHRIQNPKPPFLVIHGDADPVVPLQQSEKLVKGIQEAGGKAELIVKKGGGHPWLTIFEEVRIMADWFDKTL